VHSQRALPPSSSQPSQLPLTMVQLLAALATVRSNVHHLWDAVAMSDGDFKKKYVKNYQLHQILGVDASSMEKPKQKNTTTTLSGVRAIFKKFSFLDRMKVEVAEKLMVRTSVCSSLSLTPRPLSHQTAPPFPLHCPFPPLSDL
jgi:hypothetical protein